jgi:hypothetical protein
MRKLVKTCLNAVFLVIALSAAALSGFGRLKAVYTFFAHAHAHACATVPGGVGDYLRAAYYHLTLQAFDLSSRISFASFSAHPEAGGRRRLHRQLLDRRPRRDWRWNAACLWGTDTQRPTPARTRDVR